MARDRDGIALVEPAIRHDVARAFDAVELALLLERVEQDGIGLMRTLDLDAELGAQLIRASGVVDVAVGQQDFFQP
jgi:hypothetical protein